MSNTLRVLAATIVVGAAVVTGCVKTGTVNERAPIADLSAYKSASVAVEMPAGVKNGETEKTAFLTGIGERLEKRKVFSEIVAGGGDLTVKVKVNSVDTGSQLARAVGPTAGGDAEVSATVELVDNKQGKSVGAFDVTGNSKKNAQTTVGGVNTAAMEDTTGRAFGAAADQIGEFLAKRRAGK